MRHHKAPRVSAAVELEALPEYKYEPDPYNPLRILVKTPEGVILPERCIWLVRGCRDALIKQLHAKANRIAAAKPSHRPFRLVGKRR